MYERTIGVGTTKPLSARTRRTRFWLAQFLVSWPRASRFFVADWDALYKTIPGWLGKWNAPPHTYEDVTSHLIEELFKAQESGKFPRGWGAIRSFCKWRWIDWVRGNVEHEGGYKRGYEADFDGKRRDYGAHLVDGRTTETPEDLLIASETAMAFKPSPRARKQPERARRCVLVNAVGVWDEASFFIRWG